MTQSRRTVAARCILLSGALMALAACSSSSSGSPAGCTIPDGTYDVTTTASGGADCEGGMSTISWPPTSELPDGATEVDTCTTPTASGSSCQITCTIAGSPGASFTATYTLTSNGFTGTSVSSPAQGEDGGTFTCSFQITATKS